MIDGVLDELPAFELGFFWSDFVKHFTKAVWPGGEPIGSGG
jgi:hypothetical protein